jgi:formylmethanofuran dehydrogenase subunit E
MATKLPAAQKRLFQNIFVCKKCSRKTRTTSLKVLNGKVVCKGCQGKSFRPLKKK